MEPFGGMTVVVLLICPPNMKNADIDCKRYEMQFEAASADPSVRGMSLTECMYGAGQIAINKWLETHPYAVNKPMRYKCLTGRQAVADQVH